MSEDRPLPRDDQPPAMPPEPPSVEPAAPTAAGDPFARRVPLRDSVEPRRLSPLLPRRQTPRLLVAVDGSPACQGALVWALREAARREGTVIAISVCDDPDDGPLGSSGRSVRVDQAGLLRQVEAQVLRAIAETGVHGRARTAVLDRAVFDALTAAAHGADLVVVGPEGKTLLRPALPRPPGRRLARGA